MSNASWGAPPPPAPGSNGARSGSRGLIIGLSLGLAVLLVAALAVVLEWARPSAASRGNAGTATSAAPSGGATPLRPAPTSPSRSPTQRSTKESGRPEEPNRGLKGNSLYRIHLATASTSCGVRIRRPKPPLKNPALAPYLRKLVGCLVSAFRAPLAQQGFGLETPRVKTYRGSIKSPCGKLGSKRSPAYYCAGTILWPVASDDGSEAYTLARIGYLAIAAHEFGHHLQATTGMLSEYGRRYYSAPSKKARYALSRRLELQAQCFEGVYLNSARKSIKLTSRDRRELRLLYSFTGDEDPPSSRVPDHGSSKAQIRWLTRGLDSSNFARCNTWAASAKSTK